MGLPRRGRRRRLLAGSASALDVPALKAAVDKDLDGEYGHLDGLYKDIHNHPELGFQEARTALSWPRRCAPSASR